MNTRGPGVLTKSQREYVRQSPEERREEHNAQERYEYRQRIQRRIENAVADFRLLHEFDRTADSDVVGRAFSGGDDADELDAGVYVPSAIQFFAAGLDRGNQPLRSVDDLVAYDDLLAAVETGVERDAADRKDTVLSLDLSVEAGEEAAEDVLERLDRGSMPTREKLRLVGLLKSLGVDDDRLAEVAPEVVPGDPEPDSADDDPTADKS
jgi:hypothetical protein